MLLLPAVPTFEYGKIIPTVADGTRPAASLGVSVTPGNNTYGSYAELIDGALVTHDVYAMVINVNSGAVTTAAKDTIVTIGIDPSAGTSYTDTIADLLAPSTSFLTGNASTRGGVSYFFPLFIKAGGSIAAKASVNNATVGTVRVQAMLYCKPSRPDAMEPCSFVQTFGATVASSSGTSVTPGGASEGSWTEIGTLTKTIRWIEWGVGINSGTFTTQSNGYHVDIGIGDASNKKTVIQNGYCETCNDESFLKPPSGSPCIGVSGDKVYARIQAGPNAADSNMSVCIYGAG